jgi:crotonobetainyl-CoA:carnitine CoA-transferase CaiB-like acyl-CoA transferase
MGLALEGIKVVETAVVYAGPMAVRLLADWGADVIKIEHPVRGDLARYESAKRGGKAIVSDINYRLENYNRNKRAITLDLSKKSSQEVIYKLLEKADVFVSNFRPRELKKFKLEYDTLSQLNPRLIYASVTGQGRKGHDRDLPAYEFTSYFPRSGVLHLLQLPGTPPVQPPLGLGDNVTGLALACGIMAALFVREKTGVGQEVDVSLFQTGVHTLSLPVAGSLVTGQDLRQVDRKDIANTLVNPYQTKDGRWLFLGISQQDLYWSKFCRAIEREDLEHDPRFASFEPRIENHITLFQILEETFLGRTLEEWKVRLNEAELPWAPVQNFPEVTADPQARANDFFVSYNHPVYGHIEGVANPIKLSKSPATVRMPAPEIGQHTEEVLLEYGYTWEDIGRLKEQGIIA